MLLVLAFASCKKEAETVFVPVSEDDTSAEIIKMVEASVPAINLDENAKSSLVLSEGKLVFKWKKEDELGFFPSSSDVIHGSVQQALFHINVDQTTSSSSKFVANGWGLLNKKKYYSYFPYDASATASKVAVNYESQTQKANDNCEHLASHDYLHAAEIITPTKILNYKHLSAVAIFNLTVPDGQVSRKFNSFTLTAPSALLVKAASYNPSADAPVMANQTYVTSLSMNLGSFSCNTDKKLVLYYMMIPVAWSGKALTVKLTDTEGDTYEGTINPSRNQEAGMAYSYTAALTYKPKVIDLSANGTANSYIVSAKGDYKFKATVKGNSSTSVGTVSSAAIVWETQNTTTAPGAGAIVTSISYKSDGYIYFSTPATFKKGNALIAAKDASGNILWSWHIWCTDVPTDQQYKNSAGYLMDRNLGALATSGGTSAGLLYQWGRKDPFLGTASISSASQMAATGTAQATAARSSTNGNIAWTLKNPTTFIYYATATGTDALNWLAGTNVNANLWKNTSGDVKTIYDPCPPGYRVADGSTTANTTEGRGFYGKALGFNHKVTGITNINNKGVTWDKSTHIMAIPLASGSASYPASGCMNDGDGKLDWVGTNSMVWTNVGAGAGSTTTWNTQFSGCLDANFSGDTSGSAYVLSVNWNSGRAAGKSVRCQKESTSKVSSVTANESFSCVTDTAW